jgi:uncharacterized surface protein with fasciclin (FAS1) repeats
MKKLFLYASLLCISLVSCKKDYLVPEGELPSWLGESIYKELQQSSQLEGTFNTYCKLIDDMGYTEVLSKTGSKTIFPANDEAFERFFAGGNNKFGVSSYDELTHSQKAELLFSTMIDNAILVGTLSNKQNAAGNMLQGQLVKHATNMRLTYAVAPWSVQDMPANNKYFSRFQNEGRSSIMAIFDNTVAPMVHLTGEYMLNNNMTLTGSDSDFKILTGHDYEDGDAYIFDRKVIKSDVVCQNGYIHQLNEVLVNPGNMAEFLRAGSDTRYISRMLDYYAFPDADMTLTDQYNESAANSTDTVFAVRYLSKNSQRSKLAQPVRGTTVAENQLLDFDPGWNFYNPTLKGQTTDDEAEIAAFLAPCDEAVKDYFLGEANYILKNLGVEGLDTKNPANLNDHLDAVYNSDPSVFASILNNVMKSYLTKTVPSCFSTVQNDAFEFLDVTKDDINKKSDGNYDVTITNNGVIYKMNKLFGPKIYNSVLGPASVYKDMRTMGEMLNDHQTTAGTPSKLGADMYYYLLSMKARYGVFVPTDNETQFIVIDPTSVKDDDGLKGLRFRFDPQADGSFHVMVKKYIYQGGPYNDLNSYVEAAGASDINIETGYFNSQIKDLLDYCTIVLADSTETGKGSAVYGLYGNKYYKTKHGGVVIVDGNKVAGGLQYEKNQWSNITEKFDANSNDAKIENGTVYRLDYPIQPTIRTVMETLSRPEFYDENADYDVNAPEYDHFLNFCLQFNDEDLYTFAGILTGSESEAQKNTKMKAYRIIDDNDNWGMLSSYNYTIYAPNYEAMVQAQKNMGLPTWKKVMAIVNDWESVKDEYGFTSKDDAKTYVKNQLDKMTRFVRYHTQNSSLFADTYFKNYDPETGLTTPEPSYSTFCSNAIGIAQTLTVTGGGNKLSVKDASNTVVTIQASSANANLIARDITTSEKNGYKSIETSAFVTVHGIDTPLCFNSNRKY